MTEIIKRAKENGPVGETMTYSGSLLWINGFLTGKYSGHAMVGVGSEHSIESIDDIDGYFDDVPHGAIIVYPRNWIEIAPSPVIAVVVIMRSGA